MAPSEANVLITGESGVGKEVIANVIHDRSRRAEKPMVKLNCAAFPQAMIEAELFGYVKGAFTGAMNDFRGMIAAAEGSTLFLDEISEMPAELQTRFLRVLQEREFRPIGSTKTLQADFRLAGRDQSAGATGPGREPAPLRSLLPAEHFPNRVAPFAGTQGRHSAAGGVVPEKLRRTQLGKPEPAISPEAFQKLLDYGWPGNVRELQNAMEYAVVLARKDEITVKELPAEVRLPVALAKDGARRRSKTTGPARTLEEMERNAILDALAQCHGNKKKAAELLGIQRADAL